MSKINQPWFVGRRTFMRYGIWKYVYADFLGTGIAYYRVNGKIVRFWTRSRAQVYVDQLNAKEQK